MVEIVKKRKLSGNNPDAVALLTAAADFRSQKERAPVKGDMASLLSSSPNLSHLTTADAYNKLRHIRNKFLGSALADTDLLALASRAWDTPVRNSGSYNGGKGEEVKEDKGKGKGKGKGKDTPVRNSGSCKGGKGEGEEKEGKGKKGKGKKGKGKDIPVRKCGSYNGGQGEDEEEEDQSKGKGKDTPVRKCGSYNGGKGEDKDEEDKGKGKNVEAEPSLEFLKKEAEGYWKEHTMSPMDLEMGLEGIDLSKAKALEIKWRRHISAGLAIKKKELSLLKELYDALFISSK